MIKQIIRLSYRPIQMIFDGARHRKYQRKMMSFSLKINRNFNHCAAMKA